MFRKGLRNLITDVAGIKVGNSQNERLKSGTTVVLCEEPFVAGVQVLGGAPGTRETDLLEPHNTVEVVNALVLAGGSAFGLDAASGVQAALRERGVGFQVRDQRIPIVPAAILYDLANGGDKDWGRYPPYREMGYEAAMAAAADFAIGTAGAGAGALTAGLKGGLGSASVLLDSGVTVGALVAVNPRGSVTIGRMPHFWAAPFEIGDEFGGMGLPASFPEDAQAIAPKLRHMNSTGSNTTIGIIATDAAFTKAAAKRLAMAAHDGLARAIWPAHLFVDGDLVFALATGRNPVQLDIEAAIEVYAAAAAAMTRAIARAVYAATAEEGDIFPVWSSRTEV
jgi:L-aminopeptidase/D-esterase-like protein